MSRKLVHSLPGHGPQIQELHSSSIGKGNVPLWCQGIVEAHPPGGRIHLGGSLGHVQPSHSHPVVAWTSNHEPLWSKQRTVLLGGFLFKPIPLWAPLGASATSVAYGDGKGWGLSVAAPATSNHPWRISPWSAKSPLDAERFQKMQRHGLSIGCIIVWRGCTGHLDPCQIPQGCKPRSQLLYLCWTLLKRVGSLFTNKYLNGNQRSVRGVHCPLAPLPPAHPPKAAMVFSCGCQKK